MINKEEANRVVTKIRTLLAQGKGVGEVARATGRSATSVSFIKNGKRRNQDKEATTARIRASTRRYKARKKLLGRASNVSGSLLGYVLGLLEAESTGYCPSDPLGSKPCPTCPNCQRTIVVSAFGETCLECGVLRLLPDLGKNGNIA